MAEFVEVMKQKERMCKELKNCNECGIEEKSKEHSIMYCSLFIFQYPQEAEEIIMKWAEEHPIITNFQKLEEVFGKGLTDRLDINDCLMSKCPKPICSCNECDYYDFWNKEYKAPKGE